MDSDGFSVRTAAWKQTTIVNVCDQELIGRTVTEGKLSMHISPEFYGGEIIGRNDTLKLIKDFAIINLAGRRAVELALTNEMGSREAVREIEGVPFLMIYKF
jgi:hypothetical protein